VTPLTDAQLQAELERMLGARHRRDAERRARYAPTGQKTSIFPDSSAVSAASPTRSVSPAAGESFSSEQAA
jgi:hypothetical protein